MLETYRFRRIPLALFRRDVLAMFAPTRKYKSVRNGPFGSYALGSAPKIGAQFRQIVERVALAHSRRAPFINCRAQRPQPLFPNLVAADEVADIVAGAAVAALGNAAFGPALELVGDRDIHLGHDYSYTDLR